LVLSVPVNHRPRMQGTSKYGLLNRLWVGVVDILGVMWLQSRFVPGLHVEEDR
jgi:dolichol-phosphate mannosyltransferase